MTITKKDLIAAIQETTSLNAKQAEDVFTTIIDTISDSLINGDEVKCTQFGTFTINTRNARIGRDPNTGAQLQIQSSANTYFHASSKINSQINGNDDDFILS